MTLLHIICRVIIVNKKKHLNYFNKIKNIIYKNVFNKFLFFVQFNLMY